jgi:hypothetical protein
MRDLFSLSSARSRVASALELLTQAAEWTDKTIASGGSETYTEQLAETRDVLWELSDAARGCEHELAAIHAAIRPTKDTHENT